MKNLIIFAAICSFCSCSSPNKACSSQFIENTCIQSLGLKEYLTINKSDSTSCKYTFAYKLSTTYIIPGRIWEDNDTLYYDRFDDDNQFLMPLKPIQDKLFHIKVQNASFDAKCETKFFNADLKEMIYVYKYYKFYPLTDGDMTFFTSSSGGLLGFFISHKMENNINHIIGIYGNIYVNNYDYSSYRLGGYL